MVLLENDGTLPLKGISGRKLALYGNGARHTIKGGTGSGDVNTRETIHIEQGLEEAGAEIVTKDWLDAYDKKDYRCETKLHEMDSEKGKGRKYSGNMGNAGISVSGSGYSRD